MLVCEDVQNTLHEKSTLIMSNIISLYFFSYWIQNGYFWKDIHAPVKKKKSLSKTGKSQRREGDCIWLPTVPPASLEYFILSVYYIAYILS